MYIPSPHGTTGIAKAIAHELKPNHFTDSPWQWGVVVSATSATPLTVDLYLDGTQTYNNPAYLTKGVRYLKSYSPTPGDIVLVARGLGPSQTDRVVLGILA